MLVISLVEHLLEEALETLLTTGSEFAVIVLVHVPGPAAFVFVVLQATAVTVEAILYASGEKA